MAVECISSEQNIDHDYLQEPQVGELNGREVTTVCQGHHPVRGEFISSYIKDPKVSTCSFLVKCASPFKEYFDSEAKKQNKFDVALYQHHIQCNNEESKKHLEKSFEMMATGIIGIVVGVIYFNAPRAVSTFSVYYCAERVWMGTEEFKKAMEKSNTLLEDVHFVTWYDDYEKNSNELLKNSILEPWKPLDASGFEIMDEQYKRKELDRSLSNNIRNYG